MKKEIYHQLHGTKSSKLDCPCCGRHIADCLARQQGRK